MMMRMSIYTYGTKKVSGIIAVENNVKIFLFKI